LAVGVCCGGGIKAFRLGGGATNGFFTKPVPVPAKPLGLKGATGGAAGLLKAAMRSLNEFVEGFPETGEAAAGA
jgi:hypothetical protein